MDNRKSVKNNRCGKYLGIKLSVNHITLLEDLKNKLGKDVDDIVTQALVEYGISNGVKIKHTTNLKDLKDRIRMYYINALETNDLSYVQFRFESIKESNEKAKRKSVKLFISEIYDIKMDRVDEIVHELNLNYRTLANIIISEYDKLTIPNNVIRLEIYNG